MRHLLLVGLLIFVSSNTFAQFTYTDADGEQQLWGSIVQEQFQKAPFASWYTPTYEAYTPPAELPTWRNELQDVEVMVFLGTWCSDSQEWVPQFMHLWTALELPVENVQLIGLHDSDELRKQGPNGEEEGWNIEYVPTFIFLKGGEELGRIVEYPLTTLLGDLERITQNTVVH